MAFRTTTHIHKAHRNAPVKTYCRVATTANITIATALNNGDTLDGVTLATGDRVLVKNQSAGEENGIYVVAASPARAEDMDNAAEVLGILVYVIAGTANAGKLYRTTNTTAVTLGTTAIVFAEVGGASLTVEDEGTPLATAATVLDFVGAGVTATGAGAEKTITIAGPGVPADDTHVWMPLTTVVGGEPVLVWDGDDSLIPDLVPV